MKISLRFLLLAVALIALAVAAITTSGLVASLFHAAVGLCVILALITAVVGIHRPRAFAAGFAIPSILYVLLVYGAGQNEFDPQTARLPASPLARYGYDAVYRPIYTDMQTGKIVPDYQPTAGGTGGGGMPTVVMTGEFPVRSVYMTTFHACLVLVLGSVGGLYADWLRRTQER